mgnify:CR=1 FL=1
MKFFHEYRFGKCRPYVKMSTEQTSRSRCTWARCSLALLLMLNSEAAYVSKTKVVDVTLDQLIEDSSHIVIAEWASPPSREETIPIVAAGKEYPPYIRMVYRYRVLESLRGDLIKGSLIDVLSAHERQNERVHVLSVTENVNKSVFEKRYRMHAEIGENEPYVLFLSEREKGKLYVFVAGDSHEGLAMRAEIERKLGFEPANAATVEPEPATLIFRFNAIQIAKQGREATLTIYPVWGDAQRGPPDGFEDSVRRYRLSRSEFDAIYQRLRQIDFSRYAKLTDNDFTVTPPDMRHTESLQYLVNGGEVVSWTRPYQWLKDDALRKPLLDLEQQSQQWNQEHRSAEVSSFRGLVLRDVQGLHGGRNVYVSANGSVVVQRVRSSETGLYERRFGFKLDAKELAALLALLEKYPPAKFHIAPRPGIPEQARTEISLHRGEGIVTIAKWENDRHPDFDRAYSRLLQFESRYKDCKPLWEGKYNPDWRPE